LWLTTKLLSILDELTADSFPTSMLITLNIKNFN
jgi:hypothetical protein